MEIMKPKVVTFVNIYAAFLGCLYFLLALFLSVYFSVQRIPPDVPPLIHTIRSAFVLLSVFLGSAFFANLFLPRRKWAWVYGLVLIALGFTSIVVIPFSVALLVFWIKPNVREYYGFAPGEVM